MAGHPTSPQSHTSPAEMLREHLRSNVAHAAELLHEQGPISTFIHTNPLHSLEHLPFPQAVAEAERLLGGRGFLPNEEFRRFYRNGRITDHDVKEALESFRSSDKAETFVLKDGRTIHSQDVHRLHLLYGIEQLDPAHLPWQVYQERATKRFRKDLPEATRTVLLDKAKTDLRVSLERIGREWTLCDWVQAQLNLNLPRHLRELLRHELCEAPNVSPDSTGIERWFNSLEIPPDRRTGYRGCIDRHLKSIGSFPTHERDALHIHWLQAEHDLLRRLVPRHLNVTGTFTGIASGCECDLEAYAVTRLWHATLAVRGLDDPLSTTNPETLCPEDCSAARLDTLYRRIMTVEQDGGLALPLTETLREAIEEEVRFVGRRREQRRSILSGLSRTAGPGDPNQAPPLTLTAEAQTRLRAVFPSNIGYSTGFVRLVAQLRISKGFDWETWDEAFVHPLFVGASPIDDRPWRDFLRDGLRVRVTEGLRQALQDTFSLARLDQQAEDRRRLILGGLKEDGLTFSAWEVLQEDIKQWEDPDATGSADPVAEERLCRIVLAGLRNKELTQSAFTALRQLIECRDRAAACRQLLADLHQLDQRQQVIQRAHDSLTTTMRALGHDLTMSDLLKELTGVDIADRLNRYLIKWCGAFLDQGIASWPMPGRELGFYRSWKQLAARELSLVLGGVDGWEEAVSALPEKADDSLIATLHALQIPEHHVGDFLSRRLVQLPGWAGLIKWCEQHPHDLIQQRYHIDLTEYLAVRLFCESMLIKQVCLDVWGLDGTAQSLHRLHRDHPCEFTVRRELYRGGLPGHLESRVLEFIRANLQTDRDEWVRMAEMIWVYREASTPGRDPVQTLCRNSWRLFHLAQFTGICGSEMQTLGVSDSDRLLDMLDKFPPAAHGPIWQTAFERHYQRDLLNALDQNTRRPRSEGDRPKAQLVFCIDEREESIRRHFESQDPAYESFGTAGFFGVAMNYSALCGHGTTPLCPVVVTPSQRIHEVPTEDQVDRWDRLSRREAFIVKLEEVFAALKKNIITSYFVVDLAAVVMGIVLLGKVLLPRRFGRAMERLHHWIVRPVRTKLTIDAPLVMEDSRSHAQKVGFTLEQQIGIVEGQLRIIGLTNRFARLTIFVAHGSTSQNNPHESAHDCGACGGKHGGPNARALAAMANKSEVRSALSKRGIEIPSDTYFVGAQHNTASDNMTYFETDLIPPSHHEEFSRLVKDMDAARALNAQERCRLLPLAPKQASPARSLRHMERRSVDFTQVHPEWGHATNASAVIGRRTLTKNLFLDRRTFLQSYDPFQDPDGAILERILTAVGPVAAGIALEYYFSRVDNLRHGSGTKVPHNVSGLVGVMDGAQSDLRVGLPFQMVWVHEPLRLTVVVEGQPTLLTSIVQRHRGLQKLFDNMWLHLIVLDIRTGEFVRYEPQGQWSPLSMDEPPVVA